MGAVVLSEEPNVAHASIPQCTSTVVVHHHPPNEPQKSYAGWMRQWKGLLALGLLIAAAVVMTTYYLGFVGISVAFPVASVLGITGGVGLSGSKRRSNPTSI
jgi:hypothetical protein